MNVIVYTKDNCQFCNLAKQLLETNNIGYKEVKLGRDLTREEFVDTFPSVKTMPHIVVDNLAVGGYKNLTEWVNSQHDERQQLNE